MDRDFVKKVLAMKEAQLSALAATPANAAARDKLSREITSINIYLKCGEIADIVGMNDPIIEALNYVPAAIHDHHSDTRLSGGQKRQVTTLKNDLAALSPNYLAIFLVNSVLRESTNSFTLESDASLNPLSSVEYIIFHLPLS